MENCEMLNKKSGVIHTGSLKSESKPKTKKHIVIHVLREIYEVNPTQKPVNNILPDKDNCHIYLSYCAHLSQIHRLQVIATYNNPNSNRKLTNTT